MALNGVVACGVGMAVILIVEDHEQVRMLAESVLQEAGHETCSAATATEASAIIESDKKFDLLFVDLSLLDHQEEGLLIAQAAAKSRPGLPVIYTTGRGITDGMLALFVEPNVFLAKPYNGEQLITAVGNLLK
jgi:DNA-binding NtrC family response regulator